MNKKIAVLILLLFIIITNIVGCAQVHIYASDYFKTFKKDIKKDYPNIKTVEVKRVGISIEITYTLTNSADDEDIEKLIKKTEEYINKDTFAKAITKEDKANQNSFGRASMIVINPDVDTKKGNNLQNYQLDIKK